MKISGWLFLSLILLYPPLFSEETFPNRITPLTEKVGFTEGPVWVPEKQGMVFSDLKNALLYFWSEKTGLEIFRKDTGKANGNILDDDGRLISCESGSRRVVRLEKDGSVTVLAEHFEGQPLNGPNDLALGKDGSIYFTDPNFGREEGMDRQFLYRIPPEGGLEKARPESFNKPNGVAVSPDGGTLYLNVGANHWTLAFAVRDDGRLEDNPRRAAEGLDKTLDGMAVHPLTGDLYIAVYTNNRNKPDEQGINIFSPKGKYKGRIPIPGHTTNVCFGPDTHTLFVTSGGRLYRVTLSERIQPPAGKPGMGEDAVEPKVSVGQPQNLE